MLRSSWSILKNCGYLCRTLDIRDGSRYVWMADGVHGLKRALSGSVCNVCTVKLDNWTALAALGSKAGRHQCGTNSASHRHKRRPKPPKTSDASSAGETLVELDLASTKKTWFQRSPPWHFKVIYLASDILCASSNYIQFRIKAPHRRNSPPPTPP